MLFQHHSPSLQSCARVVCKLLDLGHAGLKHAELGQWDWDMRNWDSGTGTRATRTGATRTVELGHAKLGQFLADRTIGRAYGTVCRLSVRLSVCL